MEVATIPTMIIGLRTETSHLSPKINERPAAKNGPNAAAIKLAKCILAKTLLRSPASILSASNACAAGPERPQPNPPRNCSIKSIIKTKFEGGRLIAKKRVACEINPKKTEILINVSLRYLSAAQPEGKTKIVLASPLTVKRLPRTTFGFPRPSITYIANAVWIIPNPIDNATVWI